MTSTGPGLDDRELNAWQTFFRMQEVLRGHIEQQLRAHSGLSTFVDPAVSGSASTGTPPFATRLSDRLSVHRARSA